MLLGYLRSRLDVLRSLGIRKIPHYCHKKLLATTVNEYLFFYDLQLHLLAMFWYFLIHVVFVNEDYLTWRESSPATLDFAGICTE